MEIEFKLRLPAESIASVEQEILRQHSTSTRLRARYFDTPNGALREAGLTLRLREEGSRWIQTVKLAAGSALSREEHEADVAGIHEDAPSMPDPSLHVGTEAGEHLRRVLRKWGKGTDALIEAFRTDIERVSQERQVGGSTIEIALDRGEAAAGHGAQRKTAPVAELELELKSGNVADLAALAQAWCAEHGAWIGTASKADRGWELVGHAPDGKRKSPATAAPSLRKMAGGPLLRTLVGRCLAELLPYATRVADGAGDEEDIHQLRVGLRRLRTVFRALGDLSGNVDPSWEPALSATFGTLGEWRDRANVEETLLPELARHGAPEIPPSASGRSDLVRPEAAVRDAAFQKCLIALMAFAVVPEGHEDGPDAKRTRALMRKRLSALHKKLEQSLPGFEEAAPEEQHKSRKQLKRLRYLVEFVGPAFDAQATQRFIDRIKPAQDALGLQNDEAVALETMRAVAAEHPEAWFGAGWYAARQEPLARRSRKALAKALEHKPFWAK